MYKIRFCFYIKSALYNSINRDFHVGFMNNQFNVNILKNGWLFYSNRFFRK